MMKRDMFDCAKLQYTVIQHNKDIFELKDSVLVNCQQMIEMVLKGLLKERTGSYDITNNLVRLMNNIDTQLCKENKLLLMSLTSLYFTNRYESEDYYDYDKEEYNKIVTESIFLYNKLLSMRVTNETSKLNLF